MFSVDWNEHLSLRLFETTSSSLVETLATVARVSGGKENLGQANRTSTTILLLQHCARTEGHQAGRVREEEGDLLQIRSCAQQKVRVVSDIDAKTFKRASIRG
jgi:hypothetical protein